MLSFTSFCRHVALRRFLYGCSNTQYAHLFAFPAPSNERNQVVCQSILAAKHSSTQPSMPAGQKMLSSLRTSSQKSLLRQSCSKPSCVSELQKVRRARDPNTCSRSFGDLHPQVFACPLSMATSLFAQPIFWRFLLSLSISHMLLRYRLKT